eukprot:FR736610.1.p1 GENE.FR736610.1~~FR736610.1.p1  ORF type:complete len:191 (-),score=28.36 FR736610.1:458-1030(-)
MFICIFPLRTLPPKGGLLFLGTLPIRLLFFFHWVFLISRAGFFGLPAACVLAHMFLDSNVTFFIWGDACFPDFFVMLVVDEMSHTSTGHHDLEYRANIGTFLKWEFQCVFFLLRFVLTPAFSTVHWPKFEAESDMSCESKTSAKLSALAWSEFVRAIEPATTTEPASKDEIDTVLGLTLRHEPTWRSVVM